MFNRLMAQKVYFDPADDFLVLAWQPKEDLSIPVGNTLPDDS